MKKYLPTLGVILLVVLACVSVYFAFFRSDELFETSTSSTTASTTASTTVSTTTAPTTASTTTATTVTTTVEEETTTKEETTTENTTYIDLNTLSIIDIYPLSLSGSKQDVKHCQGITVDKENQFVYYSYTTMLVKCNFDGDVVATVTGIDGHLGDITYNEADGKIYCGYYSTGRKGFYVCIFDTKKIKKMNTKPTKDVMRTVYIKEAYKDYKASWTVTDSDGNETTQKHRYGCSGIDGVTMGPDLSKKNKSKEYLTVAYGTYNEPDRKDNDYQVLLQYDVSDWWDTYGQAYSEGSHRVGPEKCSKYFFYTGNTKWGTQTMEYFDELNIFVLNTYKGHDDKFNQYTCFAIDGDYRPTKKKLKGQPETDKEYVLIPYTDGSCDKTHNIWGWYSKYGTQGIAYMGDGLFYVCQPYETWTGKQLAICYLNAWKSSKDGSGPFTLAVDIDNDYKIKKAKHVVVTTTAAETTAYQAKSTIGKLIQSILGD